MRVVELNEKKLVGIRVVCSGHQYVQEIPRAAVQLKARLSEIKDLVYPVRLIGAFIAGDYSEEEDGYWVCVEVKEGKEIPRGMVSIVVPEQRYAVARHRGPNYAIRTTYEKLHQWIEDNECTRIPRAWHLEISEDWGNEGIADVETDLYDTIK
ncbi:GyrI-like domain-containing protein [Paenibacillus senegalensis]|uniref:GyrI-like domain-containing protein n=1 Tax=Paenibacillus senegalensis TaxID=1465766 RepID=UPI0002889298|nr:GyrI-like domain-containing protein [Paenibacillus senegalensis]